jgi:hypothetical protein
MRSSLRGRLVIGLGSCLGVAGIALPAPAGAETITIGQTVTSPGGGCTSCNDFQTQTDPTSPAYAVPSGTWTIVSWSAEGGTMFDGDLRLRVWRPTGMIGHYQLIGESGDHTVVHGTTPSFATNIPVQEGDLLGLRSGGNAGGPGNVPVAVTTPNAADEITGVLGGDPAVGDEVPGVLTTGTASGRVMNVAATLQRPDAPSSTPPATPPDTVPPQTRIDKGTRKKSTKTKAKFKFGSDEIGSTFKCKLDGKTFTPCRSPKTYKHLKPGKHVFKVRATDAAGNVDQTAAKRKFKVLEV